MKKRITRIAAISLGLCFAITFLSVGAVIVAYGQAVPPETIPPTEKPVKNEPVVIDDGSYGGGPKVPLPKVDHRMDLTL